MTRSALERAVATRVVVPDRAFTWGELRAGDRRWWTKVLEKRVER
ncbi:MAG TPA: hypothetical protein VJU61_06625 [Polyangiaceae bacterium]|nr:hypothetical protein [Polyangiaceae bacterium]